MRGTGGVMTSVTPRGYINDYGVRGYTIKEKRETEALIA